MGDDEESSILEYWCEAGRHFWTLTDMTPQQEHQDSYTDLVCPIHSERSRAFKEL